MSIILRSYIRLPSRINNNGVSKKITLVLDDYHLIQDPLIDESLAFLLDHQPENFHLIIATRDDPQLPLARLRAKSQLNELRAIDLCFSLAETAEFLNQAMGLDLPAEDITISIHCLSFIDFPFGDRSFHVSQRELPE